MESINTRIAFKKCHLSDIPVMAETAEEAYCDHYSHVWKDSTDFYVNRSFSFGSFVKDFRTSEIEHYLIYFEEFPIGIIKINLFKNPNGEQDHSMLELDKIYIKKEFCGKGIGHYSLLLIKDIAKSNRIDRIWLNVMTSSKALEFYDRHNFETVSHWYLNFDNIKDEYRKMALMELNIGC